jgi:SAM-dependent methyltransferase
VDTLVGLLLAKTVMAGTSLGVFDVLQEGALTVGEISTRCESDTPAMERLLRALLACGYLKSNKDRYELSAVSRRWLLSDARCSLRPAIIHRGLDLRVMRFEEYVREGTIQDFHGTLKGEDWKIYHEGQASHASLIADEVVDRARLPRGATDFLDLGGGHGLFSLAFCRRYPRLRARVLDLETTTGSSPSSWMQGAACDRVEFRVADIRTAQLPALSFDAVLIANVLHHFDERTNRDLLQRAAHSLRPGGVVIVLDAVRPIIASKSNQVEALLDLYFGAASGAGLWTLEQVRSWVQDAGLQLMLPITMRLLPCCKMQVGRKMSQPATRPATFGNSKKSTMEQRVSSGSWA